MSDAPTAAPPANPSVRALFNERDYMVFWFSRFFGNLAIMIQSVTMGWHVYDVARETMEPHIAALYVGFLGLATFVPLLVLAIPAGAVADRLERKRVLFISYCLELTTTAVLLFGFWFDLITIGYLLTVGFFFGIARAFFAPASTALGPMLVPRALLPRAIAWNSLAWQFAAVSGPALAGFLIAGSPGLAYGVALVLFVIATIAISFVRKPTKPEPHKVSQLAFVKEGLAYVWKQKIVFGAISLDLFAVLLGGVVALLPVFARDVLHVGEQGFGLLRASPAIGAALVAAVLASRPLRTNAGLTMFAGVAVFGMATLVFALSRTLWLSMAALAVAGGADMLSVYVRQTLIQLVTPDPMRGRVAAVSYLAIGASNELGEFESGVTARIFGPVGAAIFGGIASLFVTGLWAKLFPDLRKANRLE